MPKSHQPGKRTAPAAHAVLDTNVVVAGFLTPGATPARLLAMLGAGQLVAVYSDAVIEEYQEVLCRSKFAIDPKAISAFMELVLAEGLRVTPLAGEQPRLPDPKDIPFGAAALAAACPVVTGNLRDFPRTAGVEAISPAEFLGRMESRPTSGQLPVGGI